MRFEDRLEIQSIADDILSKFVPFHANVFYCFGGIIFTSVLIQATSGFALRLLKLLLPLNAFY